MDEHKVHSQDTTHASRVRFTRHHIHLTVLLMIAGLTPPPVQAINQYAVLVFVCQGKNMKSTDIVSKSDCYIKVRAGVVEKRTSVRNNSRNPVWNQSIGLSGLKVKPDKVP